MARKVSSRLEDLNLSRDEVERLGDALKKEEFRKLLFDYAREMNDPDNKKQFEEDITQLENERGVDVKFVHPEPQYVLKTCFNPGGEKVFVNICSNSLVGKPTSTPCLDSRGAPGTNWSMPLLQAPPREDLDKSGVLCTVYDVLFHPDTHALSAKDRRFRNFMEETALNAVEETYSVKLDRNSIKRPRLKFKGASHPTVIRTRRPNADTDKQEDDDFISQIPYPYDMPPKEALPVRQLKPKSMESKKKNNPAESYIMPKYTIKQSSDVDMANYEQNLLSHHDITVPQRLVLLVDLPYVKSSSELELDLEAQRVSLISNGKKRSVIVIACNNCHVFVNLKPKGERVKYKLELKLPYPVRETEGTAKFDQEAAKLLVTMVVDREKAVMKLNTPEGDSGIESDMGYGRTSSSEEEETKILGEQHTSMASSQEAKDSAVTLTEKSNGNIVREDSQTLSDDCFTSSAECTSEGNTRGKLIEEMFEVDVSKAEPSEEFVKDGIMAEDSNNYSRVGGNEGEPRSDSVPIQKEMDEMTAFGTGENCESSKFSKDEEENNDTAKDLLRPGIPYLMPSFSCSCRREQENTSITFVLNVKNVDPSSIDKQMKRVKGIPKSAPKEKVSCLSGAVTSGVGALFLENGSVRNEYRTVGELVSPLPTASLSFNGADVTSDEGSVIVEANRPTNECKSKVDALSSVTEEEVGANDASSSPSSGSSRLSENSMPESSVVPGANLPTVAVDVVGESLTDNLKKLLVINGEKSVERTNQEEVDNFLVQDQEMICFQVTFSSIGAGYFPQNYSFCVNFPSSQWPNYDPASLNYSPVSIEVWDNNVEVQWKKYSSENDKSGVFGCFVGQDPYNLQAYELPPFEDEAESESFSEPDLSSSNSISGDKKGVMPEKQNGAKKENEEGGPLTSSVQRRKMFKERTLSESSVESNSTKQAVKGILKRKGRTSLGRSLSESSGGEEYNWVAAAPHVSLSSSVASSPSLTDVNRLALGECPKEEEEEYDEEEEDDEEDGEKVKKIVRFSDVISQKTFRSNSSILGQRKKNQRKTRNKKRAAERRVSESENSVDEGETGTDRSNSDGVSDSSPPQKAEIPLPAEQPSSKGKAKGASKKKGGGIKGKGKKPDANQKENDSSGSPTSPQYEFKSDLIFQLEL